MTPLTLGLLVAALTVAVDQGQKLYCLKVLGMVEGEHFPLTPFLDIYLAWNHGISFSLLQQDSEVGRWLLVAFKVVAVLALVVWLLRARSRLTGLALGLVIGGAIGNAIDRVVHGAVADFFFFHLGSFSWYVFNLADCGIVVGVTVLLYEGWIAPRPATHLP